MQIEIESLNCGSQFVTAQSGEGGGGGGGGGRGNPRMSTEFSNFAILFKF